VNRYKILTNLKNVELRNGLRPSDSLASGDFTVEMETRTGKSRRRLYGWMVRFQHDDPLA
jgi:hypothetical protein